jgi:hypothetical protein
MRSRQGVNIDPGVVAHVLVNLVNPVDHPDQPWSTRTKTTQLDPLVAASQTSSTAIIIQWVLVCMAIAKCMSVELC